MQHNLRTATFPVVASSRMTIGAGRRRRFVDKNFSIRISKCSAVMDGGARFSFRACAACADDNENNDPDKQGVAQMRRHRYKDKYCYIGTPWKPRWVYYVI